MKFTCLKLISLLVSIVYQLPCKVEGDHKVFHVFGGWKEQDRVVTATLKVKIVITFAVSGVGGQLRSCGLTANAVATVEGFQSHIGFPLGGIVAVLGILTAGIAGPLTGALVALGEREYSIFRFL